jgi:2-(1,2-epoxy-1,2-dihydrophenyl)acetyl-CoA isomerase
VVLRGEGKAFCVGGDLNEMAGAPDRRDYLARLAAAAHRAVRELVQLLTPDCGTSWLLPRTVGRRVAARMALLGTVVSGHDALDAGLATILVDTAEVEDTLSSALAAIDRAGIGALRRTKELLGDRGPFAEFSSHLDAEAASIAEAASTHEAAVLIDRFLAGRRHQPVRADR